MAIKLFGKTIQTPPTREVLVRHAEVSGEDDGKSGSSKEYNHESIDPNLSDEQMSGEPNSSATNEEKSNPDSQKSNGSIDKPLGKPDIILPCPRCKSMDTKFCYFNNHKVKQPRHFCKHCQRYWTAGGSIRNIPIGAGRRKTKSFAVNRHIKVRDCDLHVLRETIRHASPLKPDGALLCFGSGASLCQSMASVLEIVEKKMVIMEKSANDTNKATNSNLCGLHPCLSGGNWLNPCSQIPPQSTPAPFLVIRAFWGTPDYHGQHH